MKIYTLAAVAAALLAATLQVSAVEGTLTVVTSYPPDTTTTFKAAFEKKYPGVTMEMLKKKTTAGIKYLHGDAQILLISSFLCKGSGEINSALIWLGRSRFMQYS